MTTQIVLEIVPIQTQLSQHTHGNWNCCCCCCDRGKTKSTPSPKTEVWTLDWSLTTIDDNLKPVVIEVKLYLEGLFFSWLSKYKCFLLLCCFLFLSFLFPSSLTFFGFGPFSGAFLVWALYHESRYWPQGEVLYLRYCRLWAHLAFWLVSNYCF